MTNTPSRPHVSKRYAIAIAAAVAALVVGLSVPHLAGASTPDHFIDLEMIPAGSSWWASVWRVATSTMPL